MKMGVSNSISVTIMQHAKRVTCKGVYYFNTDTETEQQQTDKTCTYAYNRQKTTTSVPKKHDIINFRRK